MTYEVNVSAEFENRDLAERACRLIRDQIPGVHSITIHIGRKQNKAYGYEYPAAKNMDNAGKQTIGLIDNKRFNGIPSINNFHDDYLNPSKTEPELRRAAYVSVRAPLECRHSLTSLMTCCHGLKVTVVKQPK